VAIAAPVFGLGLAVYTIWNQGYSLADYPILIWEGHLNWFSQGLGWVALIAWIALYIPSAFSAIWLPCLIIDHGDKLEIVSSNVVIAKSNIKSVGFRNSFSSKKIEFTTNDGLLFKQNAIFIKEDINTVINIIKKETALELG
jgi:hypothetical protein